MFFSSSSASFLLLLFDPNFYKYLSSFFLFLFVFDFLPIFSYSETCTSAFCLIFWINSKRVHVF